MVGGMTNMMFFLVQVMTCDSWTDPVRQLQAVQGSFIGLYLVVFNASVVFVLLNLVMAMIMDSALALGNKNEEDMIDLLKRKKQIDVDLLLGTFMDFAEGAQGREGDDDDDDEDRPRGAWKAVSGGISSGITGLKGKL